MRKAPMSRKLKAVVAAIVGVTLLAALAAVVIPSETVARMRADWAASATRAAEAEANSAGVLSAEVPAWALEKKKDKSADDTSGSTNECMDYCASHCNKYFGCKGCDDAGEDKACCLRYCNRFTGCKHCG